LILAGFVTTTVGVLVSGLTDPKQAYALAMIVVAVIGVVGLGASVRLPSDEPTSAIDPAT
jgi:hypothetical protein